MAGADDFLSLLTRPFPSQPQPGWTYPAMPLSGPGAEAYGPPGGAPSPWLSHRDLLDQARIRYERSVVNGDDTGARAAAADIRALGGVVSAVEMPNAGVFPGTGPQMAEMRGPSSESVGGVGTFGPDAALWSTTAPGSHPRDRFSAPGGPAGMPAQINALAGIPGATPLSGLPPEIDPILTGGAGIPPTAQIAPGAIPPDTMSPVVAPFNALEAPIAPRDRPAMAMPAAAADDDYLLRAAMMDLSAPERVAGARMPPVNALAPLARTVPAPTSPPPIRQDIGVPPAGTPETGGQPMIAPHPLAGPIDPRAYGGSMPTGGPQSALMPPAAAAARAYDRPPSGGPGEPWPVRFPYRAPPADSLGAGGDVAAGRPPTERPEGEGGAAAAFDLLKVLEGAGQTDTPLYRNTVARFEALMGNEYVPRQSVGARLADALASSPHVQNLTNLVGEGLDAAGEYLGSKFPLGASEEASVPSLSWEPSDVVGTDSGTRIAEIQAQLADMESRTPSGFHPTEVFSDYTALSDELAAMTTSMPPELPPFVPPADVGGVPPTNTGYPPPALTPERTGPPARPAAPVATASAGGAGGGQADAMIPPSAGGSGIGRGGLAPNTPLSAFTQPPVGGTAPGFVHGDPYGVTRAPSYQTGPAGGGAGGGPADAMMPGGQPWWAIPALQAGSAMLAAGEQGMSPLGGLGVGLNVGLDAALEANRKALEAAAAQRAETREDVRLELDVLKLEMEMGRRDLTSITNPADGILRFYDKNSGQIIVATNPDGSPVRLRIPSSGGGGGATTSKMREFAYLIDQVGVGRELAMQMVWGDVISPAQQIAFINLMADHGGPEELLRAMDNNPSLRGMVNGLLGLSQFGGGGGGTPQLTDEQRANMQTARTQEEYDQIYDDPSVPAGTVIYYPSGSTAAEQWTTK